jgi:hypothetical protein
MEVGVDVDRAGGDVDGAGVGVAVDFAGAPPQPATNSRANTKLNACDNNLIFITLLLSTLKAVD